MGIKKKRFLEAQANAQKQDKNKLQAIEYLVENEVAFSEWAEAGMYQAVRDIIQSDNSRLFSEAELNEMIESARNN